MNDNKLEEAIIWYQNNRDFFKRLSLKVELMIKDILDFQEINYLSVTSRAKDVESYKEKASKDKYDDPVHQITDMAGIRVIAYVESDVTKICSIIEKEFVIDMHNSVNKSQSLQINEVGYRSVHYIAEISQPRASLPEFQRFAGQKFEIQVRTVLQHAWAEIEHDRNYKFNGVDLPEYNDIKRRFTLLAGLLEFADQDFDRIVRDLDQYASSVSMNAKEGKLDIEIDSVSLREYLTNKFENEIKEGKLIPAYNKKGTEEGGGTVSKELGLFNIKYLSDLDEILDKYNIVNLVSKMKTRTTLTGLLRCTLIHIDAEKYFTHRTSKWTNLSSGMDELLSLLGDEVEKLIIQYHLTNS